MLKKPTETVENFQPLFESLYGNYTEGQLQRYQDLLDKFKFEFDATSAFFASSSGRVEIIGNHTDHNGGKVLTCAISLDTLAAFLPTDDAKIVIKSQGYSDILIDINSNLEVEKGTSTALVAGVVEGLKQYGFKVGGFKACITSNVLGGAGISSSASFEVLIAEILNFLYNDGVVTAELKAKIAQFSENVYFGKPCGLLDQSAISYGGLNKFEFACPDKIVVENIDVSLSDYVLILVNTGGSHADLTDEYASIPQEMFAVAKAMGKNKLVEISKKEFLKFLPKCAGLSDRAILRAFHFFSENDRVDELSCDLIKGDTSSLFRIIDASGRSSMTNLQNCSVSGSGEQLIPKALAIASNFLNGGANRVHGGGFAGTILNVVKKEFAEEFICEMQKFYNKEDIIPLSVRSVGAIVL